MSMRGLIGIGMVAALLLPSVAVAQVNGAVDPSVRAGIGVGALVVGKQANGVCGQDSFFHPYGGGLGLGALGKQVHYLLYAEHSGTPEIGWHPISRVVLCGEARVPGLSAPIVGDRGVCDGIEAVSGQGGAIFPAPWTAVSPLAPKQAQVTDVRWPATGGTLVVTGRVPGGDGQLDGAFALVGQVAGVSGAGGLCADKSGGKATGTTAGATYFPLAAAYAVVVPVPPAA